MTRFSAPLPACRMPIHCLQWSRALWRRTATARLGCCLLGLLAARASALTLEFPGPAMTTAERTDPAGSYAMPIGPWQDGRIPTLRLEGAIRQSAWRVKGSGLTTLQLLAPLRDQLAKGGFKVIFECEARTCGGYDFRYETDVLPEPEMHIDLADFRYLAAESASDGAPEHISLLVSRSAESGFVQITRVGAIDPEALATPVTQPPAVGLEPAPAPGSLASALETGGSIPLEDLSFESGSADLADQPYASLGNLAAYLAANPNRSVMIVGHTDASGSLEANIVLSRRRAASVVERLVDSLGVPRAQVAAEGAGFLAPRASNLTEAGRTKNRRVEVVLTSTQ